MVAEDKTSISLSLGALGMSMNLAACGTGVTVPIIIGIIGFFTYSMTQLILEKRKQKRKQKK